MTRAVLRWIMIAGAALVVGPVAGWLCGSIRGMDGGVDATALLSAHPFGALLSTMAAIVLAGGFGALASRLCGYRVGLFCAGLVVAWGAWQSARIEPVIRMGRSGTVLWSLSAESLILGAVALFAGYVVVRAGDQKAATMPTDSADRNPSLLALLVGLVVGGLCATGVARSGMVGQTFAAAVVAAIMGTVVGRVVAVRASVLASLAAVLLLGVVGPVMAAAMHGTKLVEDMYAGNLLPLARPMPLDWIGGGFIGVAMGVSWASSMIEKHVPEDQKAVLG